MNGLLSRRPRSVTRTELGRQHRNGFPEAWRDPVKTFVPLCRLQPKAVRCIGLLGRVSIGPFFRRRRPNMCKGTFIACSELPVVRSGLREAECSVRAPSDNVCIEVILSVVLPEADRTDFESSPLAQSFFPKVKSPTPRAGLGTLRGGFVARAEARLVWLETRGRDGRGSTHQAT